MAIARIFCAIAFWKQDRKFLLDAVATFKASPDHVNDLEGVGVTVDGNLKFKLSIDAPAHILDALSRACASLLRGVAHT